MGVWTTRTRHRPLTTFAEQGRSRYMVEVSGSKYPGRSIRVEVSGGYASITTGVPASTRSKRSMTSALRIRMQPWEPGTVMSASSGQPWM